MNKLVLGFFFMTSMIAAQTNHNLKKGVIANGYDVLAYFNNKATKGSKEHTTKYNGVIFRFSSEKNLNLFKESPQKYIPQYGGYCAYAIGKNGDKVSINPKTFEIRDGKLYLFYNAWGTNTLELWQEEGAEKLRDQADKNWTTIVQ